ncbi:MAG TPA: hypothetical protein VGQ92_19920 [Actinoplanes sp.]|jgi:hypothetical protein|nr:hypothetical protein [Actinoplanes sp.]
MRSLVTRRSVLVSGVAAVTAAALAGCSAGQVAETSLKKPSNQGVNAQSSNNTVLIRNLLVTYNGTEGYPAGANAPLQVALFNETTQAVTVLVSSQQPDPSLADQQVVWASSVAIVGGGSNASAAPSGSASPSVQPSPAESSPAQPATRPARIELAPLGYASFMPGDPESLQAIGLSEALRPGMSLNLVFEFSNGAAPLVLQAPVATPLSPVPRESGIPNENVEPEG